MNAHDRQELDRIVGVLREAHSDLQSLADAEQEKFDNMPEGLQQSDRGQKIEESADSLSDAAGDLDAVVDAVEQVSGV